MTSIHETNEGVGSKVTSVSKRLRAVLVGLLAVTPVIALAGAPAGAQSTAKPVPSCIGTAVEDPAGDQGVTFAGLPFPVIQAGPNSDITKIFLTYDASAGISYLNVQVSELTKSVPAGASDLDWYVTYTLDGADRFVVAKLVPDGTVSYSQGSAATTLSEEGDTTGAFYEGKDGVVSIAVPNAAEGAKLTAVGGFSATALDLVAVSALPHADDSPDDGVGTGEATVQNCTPAGGGGGGGGVDPVTIVVRGSGPKAKSASKSKSASFRLTSSGTVNGLKAKLKKGKSTVGTGKLATLNGKGTIKLKLKKKVKKGSYTLQLTGNDANGQPVSYKLKVKLR